MYAAAPAIACGTEAVRGKSQGSLANASPTPGVFGSLLTLPIFTSYQGSIPWHEGKLKQPLSSVDLTWVYLNSGRLGCTGCALKMASVWMHRG
jgi:hypothetical protein